jgi:hypothetical protein
MAGNRPERIALLAGTERQVSVTAACDVCRTRRSAANRRGGQPSLSAKTCRCNWTLSS